MGPTAIQTGKTKNLKKPTIVTDKTHAYPEPVEPPADYSTSTEKHNPTKGFQNGFGHSSCLYDNVGSSSPMFGRAVFPNYVSRDPVPKVIWTLTPMLIPEQPTQRPMLDQITQYEPQEMFTHVNQFQSSSKSPFQFNPSTLHNVPTFDQMLGPRFRDMFDTKPKNKEVGCQTMAKPRVRAGSLSEFTPKTILKSSQSAKDLRTSDETSPSPNVDDSLTNMEKLNVLEDNDLRFVLVAKRRQSVSLDDTPKSAEPSKQSTSSDKVDCKKRVTFALDEQDSSTEDNQSNVILSPDSLEMECPEPSEDVPETASTWYIVVDTSALLAEFECFGQFMLSDKNCRLLIPYVVKLKIEALSKGDCIGRHKAITARQILRRMATPNTQIVVQQKPDTLSACEEDAILKCCWQLLQENHAVLITENTKLLEKARIIDIECYTFEEFKVTIKPAETHDPFDLKKVKITVNNYEKPSQNLFQQTLEELNPFGFTDRVDYAPKTLFDKQNETNRILFGKRKDNDKLINLTNTSIALKNVFNDIDKIDDDIRRLEITEQITKGNQSSEHSFDDINNDQKLNLAYQYINKNTIKISGITKLNAVFDLDDELKRFYIKNDVMENRVNSKRDEWICRLTQIMEEALTEFLLKEKYNLKKTIPPWSLHEAIQVMGEKFKNQPKIKTIVGRFDTHLINCSINGKLNQNMEPIDLIKLVGFSMILVQNLKETIHCCFNEADEKLQELIKNIEDPKTDIEFNLESLITPVLRRSDELESRTPMSYINKQSDVLQYLKKHFTAMQDYVIENEPKILRTTGKDLNTLKISNNKCMTFETEVLETVEPKIIRNVTGKDLNTIKISNNKCMTAGTEIVQTVEPKVIRNVTVIEAYEEKFKKLDMEELDYEDTVVTISSENDFDDKLVFIPNNSLLETLKMNDLSECSVLEESYSSTFYNECVLACPLMKAFLTELRSTFMRVYSFIAVSMQDYKDRELYEDKRADINIKANMAHNYIMKIVDRLQSIIAREGGNGPTLKDLLVQAGDYVEEDETMAKYKEVVAGYLEQAQILENALKNLLALTHMNSELDSI
ncbi:hypothetical protein MSG28_015364 [Choristoneura fumiferana]|uniref:Uncharacterized protein n=1 Tax=Choristoneura fumiferana TaxID=7141 RepID=A0ACC0KA77_CHOFU|nr:hypothetical protein MSG28_015364 [Choristoneura fumiferana]